VLRALVLSVLTIAAGCVSGDGESLDTAEQAITGGTSDTGDPNIVLLYAEDGTTAFICTASVIAPHVLLTAAHCVSSTLHSAATKYYVFFGSDLNAAKQGDLHAVSEVHAHPDWNINNLPAGHDVGIVVLHDATTLAPVPLRRSALASTDVGKMLRLVGYGATDGTTLAGTGIKRQTQTALDSFDAVTVTYNDTMHLTCNGDSGGPALLSRNGVEEIVGLTSFGDKACTQFGVDTRVDAELAFIDPLVAMAESGPAPGTPGGGLHLSPAAMYYVGDGKADAPAGGSDVHGGCSLAPAARASGGAGLLCLALALALALVRARRAL
jgi:secreted trypsin-like serine protease